MRKLITLWLLLISSFSFAQTWEGGLGNALQRLPTVKGYHYRFYMGSGKGYLDAYTTRQIDSLLALVGPVTDSLLHPNKNLFDVPDKTVARNNLGITSLLASKANDNAVVHRTGNLTETVDGIKTFAPTLTATANNQTLNALVVDNAAVAGGFTGLTFNAFYTTGRISAALYTGNTGTEFGSAIAGVTTVGKAGTVLLKSNGNNINLFSGGSVPLNTSIRPYAANNSVILSPDGGRVAIGDGVNNTISTSGDVANRGVLLRQKLQPQHNADTLVALSIAPTFGAGDNIGSYDTFVGGSGYVNGSYTNISLNNGSGFYATANITVAGGSVTVLTINNKGAGYVVGNILSLSGSFSVTGGGCTIRVASLTQYTGIINRAIKSPSTEASEFGGDIEVTTIGKGIILRSPDGSRYRITALNGGSLQSQNIGTSAIRTLNTSNVNTFLASGNGSSTTITIPHGFTGVTTSSNVFVTVVGAASDAAGFTGVSCDATNIYIYYDIAPISGTNNLKFNILIQ